MDRLETKGLVSSTVGDPISFTQFEKYAKGPGADLMVPGRPEAELILDTLARASRYFLLMSSRFLSLDQTDDVHTRFDKLDCVSASWNWREWLNENRGL